MISLSRTTNSERPIRTITEELATYPAAEPWLGAMDVMAPGNIGWPARDRAYREMGGLYVTDAMVIKTHERQRSVIKTAFSDDRHE
jgi:hypothetical protein